MRFSFCGVINSVGISLHWEAYGPSLRSKDHKYLREGRLRMIRYRLRAVANVLDELLLKDTG